MNIYLCDLIGVFAFAFFGARVGLQQHFNILGVLTCGFVTAFGGGTIRELLLNHTPVYLHDYLYVVVAAAGCLGAVYSRYWFRRLRPLMLVFDAIGLAAFAYLGAQAAEAAQLGVIAMLFFALLTALGGGVLCDLIARRRPGLFYDALQAVPALGLAVGYWAMGAQSKQPVAAALLLGGGFVGCLLLQYRVHLQRGLGRLGAMRSHIFMNRPEEIESNIS